MTIPATFVMHHYKPTVDLRWELANELKVPPQLATADDESVRFLAPRPEIKEEPHSSSHGRIVLAASGAAT